MQFEFTQDEALIAETFRRFADRNLRPATADADLPTFRRHLKKCLRAQLPGGRVVYFRFYDPRVLRVFLDTADKDQLRELFGQIQTIYIESEDGHSVRAMRRGPDGLLEPVTPT